MDSKLLNCNDFSFSSEEESSKKIFKLEQKNQKLNVINQDLISKNQILTEQIERALKINSNLEETFEKHNDTVKELIAVRAEKEDLENRLKLSLQANEELKICLQKYCSENSSINLKYDSKNQDFSINEIGKKKSSFLGSPNKSQVEDLKKQISALEKQNSELSEQIIEISQSQDRPNNNQQINRQSSELFDNIIMSPSQNQQNYDNDSNISLRNERDKMMNLLNRQNDLTSNLELRLKKANEEIEELREKNRILTRDINKKQQLTDSYNVTIPEAAFSSVEFPLDLENMVSSIYKNPTLQVTTKVRQIISVITHYFKSKYEQIEKDLKESKENFFKLTEKTNSLIDFLHTIMPCQNVNYNALLDDESARKSLKESIDNLKKELKAAQNDKNQLEQQYEEIAKQMKSNSFQEMTNSIANLQQEHKEYKQFKKEAKSKEEELTKVINDLQANKKEIIKKNQLLEENIEKQKARLKSLKAEFENQIKNNNDAYQQTIQKLKNDNVVEVMSIKNQLENSIENLNKQHSMQINDLNTKYENELSAKNKEIDTLKQENIELLKKNNDQLNELNSQKDSFDQNIEKMKHVIKQLRIKKEKREKEIEFLKQQNSDNQKDIKDKLKTQKNEIQIRIEELQQIRSKEAKEYSQNIGNLKIEIEQLVKERNELIMKNTNLSIQLQKLETKFNAFSADRDRERREFESRMLAQRNAAQTEISTKTDEIKAQFIEKKHELYQCILKQLAPLMNLAVNPNANENNITSFIMDVRRKLEAALAREAKLREFLCINSHESIDDALAKRINHLSKRKKTRIEL